jgi:hypothetical protein
LRTSPTTKGVLVGDANGVGVRVAVGVRVGVMVARTKRTSLLPVLQRGQTYCAEEPLRVALPPPGIGVTPMTTSFGAV